ASRVVASTPVGLSAERRRSVEALQEQATTMKLESPAFYAWGVSMVSRASMMTICKELIY
ncbi:MAG TPA: hypothetical protein V6D33_17915, partial [Cyanophyceae cyanobacterium]